jgi:hypothetical protein
LIKKETFTSGNLNIAFIILFTFLSIFIFRGRLGSDDLEVFNAAYNYYQSGSYSELKQTFAWINRTLWVILDICVLSIAGIFIENKYLSFVGQFLCGYLMTLSAFLGFYFIYRFLRKTETFNNAVCATSISIFCSPILSLATGDGIESLIFLLIVYITTSSRGNIIVAYVLFLIKFYYAPIIILTEYINNNIKKIFFFVILFSLTIILKYYLIFENQNSYISRIVTLDQYFENIYNIFFSPGAGFIFIWPVFLVCIYLGFSKHTIIKLLNIFALLFFFSLFSFWHGQGSGTRYIIPVMIIFIPEIAVAVKKMKYLKIVLLIYAILNIPTLDYRNTSVFEYRNDSASHGKAYGIDDYNINFYEFNEPAFNPIIFANQIFVYKILKFDCNEIYVSSECEKVYPRTLISRVTYSLNRKLPYTDFIKSKALIWVTNLLYYLFYIVIYVMAFYSFLVGSVSNFFLNRIHKS